MFTTLIAAALLAAQPGQTTASPPLQETDQSTIGFPSVEAAMTALKARKDVSFSTQAGWTIAADPSGPTLWSFPPKGHAAYPSAVKRQIENRPDGAYVNMGVRCDASKNACDDLVRSFEALNEQMARSTRGR